MSAVVWLFRCRRCCSTSYTSTLLLPRKDSLAYGKKGCNRIEESVESLWLPQTPPLAQTASSPCFTLLDGPPYANGPAHMGHMLNKVLKDVTLRFEKHIRGSDVSYRHGWDCHGLPIEMKAKEEGNQQCSNENMFERCPQIVAESIVEQQRSFNRYGLLMRDWSQSYKTSNTSYLTQQLSIFLDLYRKGLIKRKRRPVHWSPSSLTALAESEVEYQMKRSLSLYFKLKLVNSACDVSLLAWTTTPWSICANEAIAVSTDMKYVQVEIDNDLFIVGESFLMKLSTICHFKVLNEVNVGDLLRMRYLHPTRQNVEISCPIIASDHVTESVGSGLVHLAPSHGYDDYLLALRHSLPVGEYVNEQGELINCGDERLDGLSVFDDESIANALARIVLHREWIEHSYPHDWRSKLPLIQRASLQWFIDLSKIRGNAIDLLSDVEFRPSQYKAAFINQLSNRSEWCISRQRKWGLPLPVFYDADLKSIINSDLIEHLKRIFVEEGLQAWWHRDLDYLVPEKYRSQISSKSTDILDIWFDSGVSNIVVNGGKTIDLVCEGHDQIGAWFQSLTLLNVAHCNRVPFRRVLIHGHITDASGAKMSKSLGNVVSPDDAIDKFGVSCVRLWCCKSAEESNSPFANVETTLQLINNLRLIIKYFAGCLMSPASAGNLIKVDYETVKYENHSLVNRYLLIEISKFVHKSINDYQANDYRSMYRTLEVLIADISRKYIPTVRDRLYCDKVDSPRRVESLNVIRVAFEQLLLILSPILPHLSDYTYRRVFNRSIFDTRFQPIKMPADEIISATLQSIGFLHLLKCDILAARKNRSLGDCRLEIIDKNQLLVAVDQNDLTDFFEAGDVVVTQRGGRKDSFKVEEFGVVKCGRCRRFFASDKIEEENGLCLRCSSVIQGL